MKLRTATRRSLLAGVLAASVPLLALRAFVIPRGFGERRSLQGKSGLAAVQRAVESPVVANVTTDNASMFQSEAVESTDSLERTRLQRRFLEVAAGSCRGQCATDRMKGQALDLIDSLEALNPTAASAEATELLEGRWRLVFASEDVSRSSPFFWAWRQFLGEVPDPSPITRLAFGTEKLVESVFAITDGIPIKGIGEATQEFSMGTLVNQVNLQIFGVGECMMTTTSTYVPQAGRSDTLSLTIETTQTVGATIAAADGIVFPSKELLGDSAQVDMRISYLDENLRVSRNDAAGQVFVYTRVQ
eukprot:TRINITY_DN123328_c0_g1_i1.p1 TRINITY_DN123328_c0_g1~~TRINITY_DN123328_c0_g1_i1.p1  ORF type:complete len:303 (-),score=40.50 TRINITY_DN123328_c0_g1_i1:240-1148(-)